MCHHSLAGAFLGKYYSEKRKANERNNIKKKTAEAKQKLLASGQSFAELGSALRYNEKVAKKSKLLTSPEKNVHKNKMVFLDNGIISMKNIDPLTN